MFTLVVPEEGIPLLAFYISISVYFEAAATAASLALLIACFMFWPL
jgi:hypothetical protein